MPPQSNTQAIVPVRAAPLATACQLPEPTSAFTGLDATRMLARYAWDPVTSEVRGVARFGEAAEGLPGFVHGGALAAIADEAMGWATWCSGAIAPGATVTHHYRRPVRTNQSLEVRAWVDHDDGKKLHCRAELRCGDAVAVASEGIYVAIAPPDPSAFASWPGAERFRPGAG